MSNKRWKMGWIFVAFSEYLNFTCSSALFLSQWTAMAFESKFFTRSMEFYQKNPFHNEANTILIMKMALFFFSILVNIDRIGKIIIWQHNFSNKLSFKLKLLKHVNYKNWSTVFFKNSWPKEYFEWRHSKSIFVPKMYQKMYNSIFRITGILASLWNVLFYQIPLTWWQIYFCWWASGMLKLGFSNSPTFFTMSYRLISKYTY